MAREPSITLTFRAPKNMVVELDHMAGELGRERSECIREAVAQYLDAGPNSLQRRVSLIERKLESIGHGIAPSAPETASYLGPHRSEASFVQLESELASATAEAKAGRSAMETMEALIKQGGGAAEMVQWLVDFRKQFPPK